MNFVENYTDPNCPREPCREQLRFSSQKSSRPGCARWFTTKFARQFVLIGGFRAGRVSGRSGSVKRIRVKVAVKRAFKCPRKCRESAKRTLRRALNRVTYSDTLNRPTFSAQQRAYVCIGQ